MATCGKDEKSSSDVKSDEVLSNILAQPKFLDKISFVGSTEKGDNL
jgi:hypothetical protein